MPKGGARTKSGPAPDPQALRRDKDGKDWVELPAQGREGDPPSWPLSSPTKREWELWQREWRRPQAVMWEANGQEVEVALYVRSVKDAEKSSAPVSMRTLVRQQMDALGLTVPGLRANRWTIAQQDEPVQRGRVADDQGPSAKDRLRVIDGEGA